MIYGKLPVVLLSTISTNKHTSTNSIIASYILSHIDEVKHLNIQELAAVCHVANSSISRFCKEIGLNDFSELKRLMNQDNYYFESVNINEYVNTVQKSLTQANDSINLQQIRKLVNDIKTYNKVSCFGLLKASSAAISLQSDLLMLGKQVYTNINYNEQMDYIFHSDEDDLIIIFSYTGSYFDYPLIRENKNKLKKPKIWLISSKQENYPDFIDEVITFDSKQDQLSHPYQLIYIAGLISQIYAH